MKAAVDAATAVAREVGLMVRDPRVLRDVTNVLVHLAPAPVVARVPVTFTRLRGRSWIEHELEATRFLADSGVTAARPATSVNPGPHESDGFLITLWEFVEHDHERVLDGNRAGSALREIHEQLAHWTGVRLDHFSRLDEIAALVVQLKLSTAQRRLFQEGIEALRLHLAL